MDNITEIVITGATSAGAVGSILGYFIKRLIADIDEIKQILNGSLGEAGLLTQVKLNTQHDETREEAFNELKDKFEAHVKDNPNAKIEKAIDVFRKEIERDYRKK